ncbi:MAG: FAD-dependent oxidoreductase [Candidatus Aminicenantes bacterium]|nr:FAD-dependent oxidoreductase [Candidatus Aminicenantes bacterium]
MDDNKKVKKNSSRIKKLEADVVVIGAGSAGLSAALTAASGGAKVTVLEKMAAPGGYSLAAHGMFAAESSIQKKDFVWITKEEAFKNHMLHTNWGANARLIRHLIDKSADTIDWLTRLGVEFTQAINLWPNGPRAWHVMKGSGKALIKVLFEKFKANGGRVYTGTTAQKLLVDEKNRVTGVTAQDTDGNTIRVNAPVVINAGGSYANNKEMLKKHTGLTCDITAVVEMQQTGDHLQLAWEAGAAADGMGVLMAVINTADKRSKSHLWTAALQPLLWVNQLGERFCDESITFFFPTAAAVLSKQKNGIMYTLFDESTKKKLVEEDGSEVSMGLFVPVTAKLDQLDNDLEQGIKTGDAFAADSLQELAEKISLAPGILEETVTEYNRSCREKHDMLYAKNPRYLQPVKDKKFYAVKSSLHIFATLGGIKINHKTEVLTEKFEVIPGFYAVGNCAGGMYNTNYEIFTTGGALAFAINSGRIAAENSLKYLGKQ